MDLTAPYCPTRKELEERGLILVDKLAELTSRLLPLVGTDHQEFISTKTECDKVQIEIAESHRQLEVHCSEHGC